MASQPASFHKVKSISFLGRRVPVMLQDVNGPCPLLAIANVLLLRNQLQLSAGVGEVSQDRLVAMVAERLLDANAAGLEAGSSGAPGALSEEQRASLAHNLSDAISLLPKLTTGIDVNLRFHDIAGFEYTQETAVFDLLDIPLVHGWLVDPQDEATARAVGQKSYNELVVQLVTALGSAATPTHHLTPCGSLRGQRLGLEGPSASPPSDSSGAAACEGGRQGAAGPAAAGMAGAGEQCVDAEALAAALKHSLRVSLPAHQQAHGGAADADPGSSGPASAKSAPGSGRAPGGDMSRATSNMSSMQTSDSMRSVVNRMLGDLVSDAFLSGSPLASQSRGHSALEGGSTAAASSAMTPIAESGEGGEEATSLLRPLAPPSSASGSCPDLPAAAAADEAAPLTGEASSSAAVDAVAGGAGVPFGNLEERVQLTLSVDKAAALAGEPAVRVGLSIHQQTSGLGMGPRASARPVQAEGNLAAGVVQRSTPATPHVSLASLAAAAQLGAGSDAGAGPAPSAPAAGDQQPSSEPPAGSSGSSPGPGRALASAAGSPAGSAGDEAAVRDALLAQQFLEGHPSQLTYHGLVALQEGLRPNQLAVFFRNNHFNTLFKGPDSQLYILVTDEGFQFESDVVWEQLISVDGDTALVGADFRPFQPHASHEDGAARQAVAQEDEWAAAAAAAAAAGGDTHDADLALAMQLQAEEEDRVREEQERRRAAAARQQAEAARSAEAQQAQRVLPSQRRPSSAGSAGSSGSGGGKKKKSTDACSIM